MAKMILPVNFQDDIISESMGGKRRYNIIQNVDGTVSLDDVTEYDQVGSNFGAAQINQTNTSVNSCADAGKIIESLEEIEVVTQPGYMAGALAVKELKKYVADGKALIASAITNKGVPTASDEKFSVMAENIGKMSSIKPGLLGQNQLRNTAVGSNITLNLSFSSGTYQYVAVCLTNAHFRENGNASLYWNNNIGTRLIEHGISSGGDFYQCDTIFSINKISKNSNYNVSITENKGNIDSEHHQVVLQAMAFGIA